MNTKKESWKCISHCGACCRLAPDERVESIAALNPDQLKVYLSFVGEDGWCRHYDKTNRICRIYEKRPDFCRVSTLGSIFHVSNADLDSFAIHCCKQHIRSIYGGRSRVMSKFQKSIRNQSNVDS